MRFKIIKSKINSRVIEIIKKNQKNQYFVYDVNFKLTNNFNFFPKR